MHKPVLTSLTMEKTIEVIIGLFRDQAPAQVLLPLSSSTVRSLACLCIDARSLTSS